VGRPQQLVEALGDRVVNIAVDEPEPAIAALRSSSLVASTTQLGDTLHVLLVRDAPDADTAGRELVSQLAAAGLHGAAAQGTSANLEDVFVSLLISDQSGGRT